MIVYAYYMMYNYILIIYSYFVLHIVYNSMQICIQIQYIYRLLQRSMKTRYPYVDPLNVIQAEAMKRSDIVIAYYI